MLEKKYNHLEVEAGKYEKWLKSDYFKSGDLNKPPFSIVLPPPNVTGKLHLGHAMNGTIQDIIIRYKRMDGYDTLWLPGMDHAGIATQAKVDAKLRAIGLKPREMAREEWLNYAWNWKEEYAKSIREQWAKLGFSLDYSKEKFTLDNSSNTAVNEVFIKLYNKGYIYRGERIINWDPDAMTALSNEEVIYKEVEGKFYHLKYMLEDGRNYLEIVTTRPETLFGDTAVAVNPKDDRYKHLVGQKVMLPIVNKLIPIIADDYVDMAFGTGIVKITPAHDPNDFEVGNRHNLERIKCINPDGKMNANALQYIDLDRFTCRERLAKDLESKDILIKITNMTHAVGHSERSNAIVEPYLSKQWFVKMDILAKQVLANQKTDNKVNFIPERFEKILINWMESVHDWCISRQLWWGHQIPVWYKGEEVYCGLTAPFGDGWTQDPDVLDTWFSSALWPFSTLGWPSNFDKHYYPTNVLVTAYDIIFFWVARMVFQGLEFTQERPFKETIIHGLIRAQDGQKMSKSLGNGVDPMDVIDKYGTDSLRYFLTTTSAPGQDLRYDEDKVKSTWNFINKIWNASRFVMLNIEDYKYEPFINDNLSTSDKWILTKLNLTIEKVRKHMNTYEFNVVGSELYSFVWNDFCDWYIELAKVNMNDTTKSVLVYTLINILKMLHPFMPYVTEEIYLMLPHQEESIMISSYPIYNSALVFGDSKEVDSVIELIQKIRRAKLDHNIGKDYYLVHNLDIITNNLSIIEKLLKTSIVLTTDFKDVTLTKIELAYNNSIVELYYNNLINVEEQTQSLIKEQERLVNSINKRELLLSNQNYVAKAPATIIDAEIEILNKEKQELSVINAKLN